MELQEILTDLANAKKTILYNGVIFALVGVILYFALPTTYYASGTLVIKRAIYPYSTDHFTYEGYYGQQAAMAYTNSVMGLIESEDIRAKTLSQMNVPISEQTLRKYDKKIKTIKNGPQLINLVTKDKSPKTAETLWVAVTDSTIEAVKKINVEGDPYVSISRVLDRPVIKEGYRNIGLNIAAGALFGMILSITYLVVKNYFKTDL